MFTQSTGDERAMSVHALQTFRRSNGAWFAANDGIAGGNCQNLAGDRHAEGILGRQWAKISKGRQATKSNGRPMGCSSSRSGIWPELGLTWTRICGSADRYGMVARTEVYWWLSTAAVVQDTVVLRSIRMVTCHTRKFIRKFS